MIVKKKSNFPLFCLFILLITTLFADSRRFVYVHEKLSWYEAQHFCRIHYTDLATITSPEEAKILRRWKGGWIGLHRISFTSSWKWSEGEMANLTNWDLLKGDDLGDCINMKRGLWIAEHCDSQQFFFCNHEKAMVLVKEKKTWEEALQHCRSMPIDLSKPPSSSSNYLYDLASLTSEMDCVDARNKIQEALTDEVWTGLRFLAGQWFWVSGENWDYQDLPLCPAQWQHCGTLAKNSSTHWEVRDCMERRNFLCAMVNPS